MFVSLAFLVLVGCLEVLLPTNAQEIVFRIGTRTLYDGDTINITDIGYQAMEVDNTGNALICDTSSINMKCCTQRETNTTAIGEWYSPTGQAVISLFSLSNMLPIADVRILYRVLGAQQVRLESRGFPTGPLGEYTCSVPDENGTITNATINIINTLSIASVSIDTTNLEVETGEPLNLTCTTVIVGRGIPNFTWTGQGVLETGFGQGVHGRMNMFTDTLTIERVRQINVPVQCIASIADSVLSTSVNLSVAVPHISASIAESRNPIVGLNYTLTCNVTISSSLPINISYSWMKDNILLVEQTSGKLELGPLDTYHNGTTYTCNYTASSPYFISPVMGIDVTHEIVLRVLSLRIGSRMLLNGDSINITDIGNQPTDMNNPGNTIVCDTTDVNMECCTSEQTGMGIGSIGKWYLPTGEAVDSLFFLNRLGGPNDTLYRVRDAQQVRLESIGAPIGPLGVYTCSIPVGSETYVNASIKIINILSVISVSINYTNSEVVAGESLTLTCTATITGRGGTPSFTWTGQVTRGPQLGQAVQGSTNMFTDTLTIERVSQINPIIQCDANIRSSFSTVSVMLSVTVPTTSAIIMESTSPAVGQSYTLTCNVTIPSSLMANVSYNWTQDNTLLKNQTTNQLNLSHLELTDNGTNYTCYYLAVSPVLTDMIMGSSNSHTLTIVVIISSINTSTSKQIGVASVDNITLTCTGTLSGPAIPMLTWTGPISHTSISLTEPPAPSASNTFRDSLVLTQVRQSYGGTYTCTVSIGASSMSKSETLTVRAPEIPISITESQPPVCLRNYTIICNATPPSSLNITNPSYQWSKNGQVLTDKTNKILNLSPLQCDENGTQYTCQYKASSEYVTEINISSSIHIVSISIAALTAAPSYIHGISQPTSLMLTWQQSELDVVHNYLIKYRRIAGCFNAQPGNNTIAGSLRNYTLLGLEENITYEVTVTAVNSRNSMAATVRFTTTTAGPNGAVSSILRGQVSFTSITISWKPPDCLLQNSPITSYNISYSENTVDTGPLFTFDTSYTATSLFPGTFYTFRVAPTNRHGTGPYKQITVSTEQPKGTLLFNGVFYSNNSIRNISDIGKNSEALYCFTDKSDCCRTEDNYTNLIRDWYFPNGKKIGNIGNRMSNTLYITKGPQAIILHRDANMAPIGMYRCEIFNKSTYIGLYDDNKGLPKIQSILYNTTAGIVTCISTGGPVTNLTWNRNGKSYQQSKIIVDTVQATYHNILYISSSMLSHYTGIFGCTVSNSRGRTSKTTHEFKSIGFSGNKSTYEVGSSANVICYSNFTYVSIQWLNTNLNFSHSTEQTNDHKLRLIIHQISEEVDGTIFTCEVINILPTNVTVTSTLNFRIKITLKEKNSLGGIQAVFIGITMVIIFCILTAILILIGAILFIRRRKKSTYSSPLNNEFIMYAKEKNKSVESISPITISPKPSIKLLENSEQCGEQTYENTRVQDRFKPVLLEEFTNHVTQMHANRDNLFEIEYTSIEKAPNLEHSIAVIPQNRARNRFGNIYPYNVNRVILNTIPGVEHSDYINASYIDGYGRNKVYIAAQGPMVNSLNDFWRMIWEQKCPTIVMLTKVFEGRKKCEEYWPQTISDSFVPCSESSFVIKLNSSLPFPEFVVKKMTITKTDSQKSPIHDVTLFHYLGWPDHGVPANAISMINFIRRVRKSHPYSNTDFMVVHCSAGVGRTGTFITLDYMLERIKTETSINIYEYVSELRKQRVLMVQTVAQYMFIHNALDELLTCGDTEVAAANMRIVIGRLSRQVEEGSEVSGFQRQYETLTQVTSEIQGLDFSQSVTAANIDKNRYEDKIPFNHTRVILRCAAAKGSDYINASFVEGYRQKGAYIATQGPLIHTVTDLWKMIWEQDCRCIVMLCQTNENEKEVSHRYWPEEKGTSADYGKLTVTFKDQKVFTAYAMRKFEISESHARTSAMPAGISITQFQYLRWQEDTVPNSTSAILEIANFVQKVQISTGNKPIVVMCNDGVGRSGTFISIHAQMERMKSEGVIDVFQFIKSVRFQRANMVANKEQYEFCHQVLADFLDGFDTYANFKEII